MEAKLSEWRTRPPTAMCRCCLSENCYKDIVTEYYCMGIREVYADMLKETFDVMISYCSASGLSRLICETCIGRLREAAAFKKQVQECEAAIMRLLGGVDAEIKEEDISIEVGKMAEVPSIIPETSDFDNRDNEMPVADDEMPVSDDDNDDDLDDQPLTMLASRNSKKDSLDLQELIDIVKPAEKRKSSSRLKAIAEKKPKKENVKDKNKQKNKGEKQTVEKKKKGPEQVSELPNKTQTPLFQIEYDRTKCKPLGTIADYNKLTKALKKIREIDKKLHEEEPDVSRSPSPYSERSASPNIKTITAESDIKPIPLEADTNIVKTKKRIAPNLKQNALTVFEYSTVYPFIYSNNKFKCFICNQPFLETSLLSRHMSETHTFAPLKKLVNNRRETILKVDVTEITCKVCMTQPVNLQELKTHLKETHNMPVDPDLHDNMIPFKLEEVNGSYRCVMCDQTFIKVRLLVIHMSAHFYNYSCEICGSVFMTLRLMKKHLEVHENGSFPCDRCDKVFATSHKLSLHVRGVHLKQLPRRCPLCPARFNSNYRRTIHLQDAHAQPTRVHKCDLCGRAFNLRYHLVCHTRSVHLQERNQQCAVCLHRFCNKETLKRHMLVHTGERNHKCDVCHMAFLRRKNLNDHMRLHQVV